MNHLQIPRCTTRNGDVRIQSVGKIL